MGSFQPRRPVFGPEELDALEVAYSSTLDKLRQQGLEPRADLKAALRFELIDVAEEGDTNPRRLESKLLERIGLI